MSDHLHYEQTVPNTGDIIIQSIIRASALESVLTIDEGYLFIWSANAAEQIEAALNEAGYKLIKHD